MTDKLQTTNRCADPSYSTRPEGYAAHGEGKEYRDCPYYRGEDRWACVIPLNAVRAALTMSDATIRLNAGEMTAQEMRTVQAVLKWKLAELEHIARTGTPRPADKCTVSGDSTSD